MLLTKNEIKKIVDKCFNELISKSKIKFSFNRNWSSFFPSSAGVYAIFSKNKLIYIGETANLKERMKEVKRTYNHTFRKKLGKNLFINAKLKNGKYSKAIENKLDDYFRANLSFTFVEVNFGRLEIESHLIHNNKTKLLNSISIRNKIY